MSWGRMEEEYLSAPPPLALGSGGMGSKAFISELLATSAPPPQHADTH